MRVNVPWQTCLTPPEMDVRAPDGSEIRLLAATTRASMVHCTLPAGAVTRAVRHRTVDELWYFLSGSGQLWRKAGDVEEVTPVGSGVSVSIPLGVSFQFRADAQGPLTFVITTTPPWPGETEAIPVPGAWQSTEG